MNKNHMFIVIFLLTACTAAQLEPIATLPPTETPVPPTATPLPIPTETPIPLKDLNGSLFFDYNGSGLWDEGEPPIANFGVCAKPYLQDWVCSETDAEGNFVFEEIGPEGGTVYLKFEDPNADEPALAFRYINLWHGPVVIEAYEMNGVQVPEQHLNDTEVLSIDEFVLFEVDDEIELGLMQGFLTMPFIKDQYPDPYIFNYFDIIGNRIFNEESTFFSTQDGNLLNYNGELNNWFLPNPYIEGRDVYPGVGDSHTGLDYLIPEGNWIVSGSPRSSVFYLPDSDGELRVDTRFDSPTANSIFYMISYGHLQIQLVSMNKNIYRGQILGISGSTGDYSGGFPQLHFGIFQNHPDGYLYFDPYRCTIDFEIEPENYWGSDVSWWTKDNEPQFAK